MKSYCDPHPALNRADVPVALVAAPATPAAATVREIGGRESGVHLEDEIGASHEGVGGEEVCIVAGVTADNLLGAL